MRSSQHIAASSCFKQPDARGIICSWAQNHLAKRMPCKQALNARPRGSKKFGCNHWPSEIQWVCLLRQKALLREWHTSPRTAQCHKSTILLSCPHQRQLKNNGWILPRSWNDMGPLHNGGVWVWQRCERPTDSKSLRKSLDSSAIQAL